MEERKTPKRQNRFESPKLQTVDPTTVSEDLDVGIRLILLKRRSTPIPTMCLEWGQG